MHRSLLLAGFGLGLATGACGDDRPPRVDDSDPPTQDAGPDLDPLDGNAPDPDLCNSEPTIVDATGMCGNLVYELEQQAINLYFVVDRSASMGERLEGGSRSKYAAGRNAIEDLLEVVGARVSYGASVFPGIGTDDACSPGGEIFSTRRGDRPGCPSVALDGLTSALEAAGVSGGTPTAAHLARIGPVLKALPGDLSVILLTDGGPNCNAELECGAEDCTLTFDGYVLGDGRECSPSLNCCDPAIVDNGNLLCTDFVATETQVQDLYDHGVRTFVVGMPGSEPYAQHLSRLAELGGTARTEDPSYYPVADATDLSEVFLSIGASVALTCDVTLLEPPEDPALVNLYYDGIPVPFDPEDGWSWADDAHLALRINGTYCDALETGSVAYVQVQWGCATYIQ